MFIIYRNFTKQNERLVLLFQTSANNLIKLLYNATVYLKTYFDLWLYTKTRNSHEEHVHF